MDYLQLFRQVARNRSEIRLLNIYKGLPISYDTNIEYVMASEITVPSSKHQLACLYHQGVSYLQGEELPFVIRSEVMSLNLAKESAVFSNFEVAKNNIGNRTQIRVEPEEPLVVSIKFSGSSSEFLAPLADISANGASVYFEAFMFPARLAKPGSELTMSLSLPDAVSNKIRKLSQKPKLDGRKVTAPFRTNITGGQDGRIVITAHGKVIAVRPEPPLNRFRMSTQLFFKDLSQMVILQYITQRQSEIIQDLRMLSEELYKPKK